MDEWNACGGLLPQGDGGGEGTENNFHWDNQLGARRKRAGKVEVGGTEELMWWRLGSGRFSRSSRDSPSSQPLCPAERETRNSRGKAYVDVRFLLRVVALSRAFSAFVAQGERRLISWTIIWTAQGVYCTKKIRIHWKSTAFRRSVRKYGKGMNFWLKGIRKFEPFVKNSRK